MCDVDALGCSRRRTTVTRREGPAEAELGTPIQKGPETIDDLGAGVPTGTFTVFPGCAGLLIGFAKSLLDESTFSETREGS